MSGKNLLGVFMKAGVVIRVFKEEKSCVCIKRRRDSSADLLAAFESNPFPQQLFQNF